MYSRLKHLIFFFIDNFKNLLEIEGDPNKTADNFLTFLHNSLDGLTGIYFPPPNFFASVSLGGRIHHTTICHNPIKPHIIFL